MIRTPSGSGGHGRDDDRSALLTRALTRALPQAPPLDGLREAISSPLLAPLPLFAFRLTSFNAVGLVELLEAFFELESVSESSAYSLAAYLETIISKDWPVSGSEHDIAKAVSVLVAGLLNWLEASRGGNILCMSDSSNSGGVPGYVDGSSIEGLHCDYQVWLGVQQALLFKGEERAREQDMLAAIGHLGADLASLSKMWSGQAEYVLCYVAAGTFLQFFALVKEQGRLMEMTEVHNCGTVQGRLRAVHNVINIYRVLASQIEQLKGANTTQG